MDIWWLQIWILQYYVHDENIIRLLNANKSTTLKNVSFGLSKILKINFGIIYPVLNYNSNTIGDFLFKQRKPEACFFLSHNIILAVLIASPVQYTFLLLEHSTQVHMFTGNRRIEELSTVISSLLAEPLNCCYQRHLDHKQISPPWM
jgi:hypothetical protein